MLSTDGHEKGGHDDRTNHNLLSSNRSHIHVEAPGVCTYRGGKETTDEQTGHYNQSVIVWITPACTLTLSRLHFSDLHVSFRIFDRFSSELRFQR